MLKSTLFSLNGGRNVREVSAPWIPYSRMDLGWWAVCILTPGRKVLGGRGYFTYEVVELLTKHKHSVNLPHKQVLRICTSTAMIGSSNWLNTQRQIRVCSNVMCETALIWKYWTMSQEGFIKSLWLSHWLLAIKMLKRWVLNMVRDWQVALEWRLSSLGVSLNKAFWGFMP